jgi:formate hydrogenlyase subunit 4
MTGVLAGALQLLGGVVLAPVLPGAVQTVKARLQGRRGPSPLQPYRELRRLWAKASVEPEGVSAVYRSAPCVAAAGMLLVVALVPVGGRVGSWGLGDDAILLVGALAIGRAAVTAAAWDAASGFALMGAARDLMIAVFAEALLVLVLLAAALTAGDTSLVAMTHAGGGTAPWTVAAHWCGAGAFGLVLLAETGREPIDNPDTHLELTMIHEGPLLEYSGRDLALLAWVGAARHWVFVVLGAGLFLPHWGGFAAQLGCTALWAGVLVVGLAATETTQAKLRLLRVPALLMTGAGLAVVGVVATAVSGLPA